MLTELILIALIVAIIYNYVVYKRIHYHFDKYGVKYLPGVPVFGNNFWSTFAVRHVLDDIEEVYKAFPNERYVGYLEGSNPVILVRDPELMKIVTIKDFDHFVNRKNFFPKEIEPLLGQSLLSMKDDEWRHMRARLSYAFNGSKMKNMLPSMVDISLNVVDYLKEKTNTDVDVIDVMRRYTTDVIASTGFDWHVSSFKERNNTFYIVGQKAVTFKFLKRAYYFLTIQFPVIAKAMQFLGIQLLPREGTEFFRQLVQDTMKFRIQNNLIRPDFIHSMLETSKEWTTDQAVGQIFFSFIANYESGASTLTICIHEIALHPEIEDRLYQEIREHQERNGKLSFENIAELKYLDCVLNETSRKWAVALMMDRLCSKTYTLPPAREGGIPYTIRPGELIYNVVNAVQRDPQYHPDPETFDPERFSDDNKSKIRPFTFMPFGMGPRSCLGIRYTVLEMKVVLYHLILNFKITRCKKTTDPIRLQPSDFLIRAVGETYVRFQPRS